LSRPGFTLRKHRRADGERNDRRLDPDDDQRSNRHDGRDLQQDRIGKQAGLDQLALHEEKGGGHADHHGHRKCKEGDLERHQQRAGQQSPVGNQRLEDGGRRRHQVDRHFKRGAQGLP
jgi:hypothetical protein